LLGKLLGLQPAQAAGLRRTGKVIAPLTVREILDEKNAMKLA
jgi:hypothetical protein